MVATEPRRRGGEVKKLGDILAEYVKVTTRPCPKCNEMFTAILLARFCPPCATILLAEMDAKDAELARQQAAMRDTRRVKFANLPPVVKGFANLREPRPGVVGFHAMGTAGILWALRKTLSTKQEQPRPWLVFVGSVGTGKSHIAEATARLALRRGCVVRWEVVTELLNRAKLAYANGENPDGMFADIESVPMLVLDELGKMKPTEFVQDRLYSLINYRYARQLPTLITTNYTKDQLTGRLGDMGQAIADRVFDIGSGLVQVCKIGRAHV